MQGEKQADKQLLYSDIISVDNHRTVHIDLNKSQKDCFSEQQINDVIQEAGQVQVKQGSKAIWIHLNEKNLQHIQHLLFKDFIMHRGVKNAVSLYKWCSKNMVDSIPAYSRFFIGCAAAIIRDNKVFLVKEKSGDRKGYYGMPGGRADAGQLISTATQRQLFEQTNIKGKFEYIIYFRQLPKSLWGASDIYFVSLVSVQDSEFDKIKLCQNQIQDYKWVPLEEYAQFMKTDGFGSQVHVGRHMTDLYKKGYDFSQKSNLTITGKYRQNSEALMTEHFVTGINLLKPQQK